MSRQLHLARATLLPRRPRGELGPLDTSVTRMRVLPTDLDLYGHVNNGTYLQMMDVARSNYLADVRAFRRLVQLRWYPVVAASTVTYRRSLLLGQRFELRTRVLGWDERVAYLEQEFVRGGERVARGIVAGRFLTRRTHERVPATRVVETLWPELEQPELPADVAAWARAFGVAFRVAG